MSDQLGKIQSDLEWIKNRMESNDNVHDKILKILDGNGTMGICGKVAILWYGHSWVVGLCGVVIGALVTKWLDA